VVHEKVYKTFLDRFTARAGALRVGNGLDAATEMGPVVSAGQLDTVMEYVRIGQSEGARLVCGGHRLDKGALGKGFFHEPTVFADVAPSMRIAQEEIFGPVVAVIPYFLYDVSGCNGSTLQS